MKIKKNIIILVLTTVFFSALFYITTIYVYAIGGGSKTGILVNIDGIDRTVFESEEDINDYIDTFKTIYNERHNVIEDIDVKSIINYSEGKYLIDDFRTPEEYAVYTMNTSEEILKFDDGILDEGYGVDFPTKGVITSSFGIRKDPLGNDSQFHKGIDIGANMDSPIYSPISGVVTYSGWMNGYGNTVIVKDGNREMLFGHCSTLLLNVNDNVSIGDQIARVGNTGNSTGPHLHLGVFEEGEVVNPQKYLG